MTPASAHLPSNSLAISAALPIAYEQCGDEDWACVGNSQTFAVATKVTVWDPHHVKASVWFREKRKGGRPITHGCVKSVLVSGTGQTSQPWKKKCGGATATAATSADDWEQFFRDGELFPAQIRDVTRKTVCLMSAKLDGKAAATVGWIRGLIPVDYLWIGSIGPKDGGCGPVQEPWFGNVEHTLGYSRAFILLDIHDVAGTVLYKVHCEVTVQVESKTAKWGAYVFWTVGAKVLAWKAKNSCYDYPADVV